MKTPNAIGTVLPTRASLAATDRWHAAQQARDAEFAAETLAQCERREVGGEVRHYFTASIYATVRQQRARWFETRADGDYSIPAPKL